MEDSVPYCNRCGKYKPCDCGRPTLYDDTIIPRSLEYINSCEDYEIDGKLKVRIPTVEGLALHLNVNRDTLYKWVKKHDEFSDTINIIHEKQKERLINSGLSGAYNATIAKFILSANHNMSDRVETKTDVTSQGQAIQVITAVPIAGSNPVSSSAVPTPNTPEH